jgi:hypothetical protein
MNMVRSTGLLLLVCLGTATSAKAAVFEGVPIGLAYHADWDTHHALIGITMEVSGKRVVTSANLTAGFTQETVELLSMVDAAIRQRLTIRVTGTLLDTAPPGATYPRGVIRIESIEVDGYIWRSPYLK